MKIFIPNNFIAERKYIVEVLFSEYLGLDFQIEIFNEKKYLIVLDTGNEIEFADAFWANLDETESYIKIRNIPQKVLFGSNNFLSENDIPIIYGNNDFQLTENKIYCGIDIFASSFFMLTRWEEIAISEKDDYKRFVCSNSLAQKYKFHQRPVVNEYVEMLWQILLNMGYVGGRKQLNFSILPTHDIDFLFKFPSFKKFIKTFAGDILKRRDLKMATYTLKSYFFMRRNKTKDPYDTFDYFMNISEANNLKSRFYFIAGKKGEADVKYNFLQKNVEEILKRIKNRGHIVGIHGGFSSYNDIQQFDNELDRFSKFNVAPKEGRQHFLRFENPKTWNIWNESGLNYDSTMAYANTSGFRAGTCLEYPVFDVVKRQKLGLRERPLIFMETASRKSYPNKEDFFEHLQNLKNVVKKYNGQFVFLWHNSNLNDYGWEKYKDIYPEIFE